MKKSETVKSSGRGKASTGKRGTAELKAFLEELKLTRREHAAQVLRVSPRSLAELDAAITALDNAIGIRETGLHLVKPRRSRRGKGAAAAKS